jgi:DNA-directed RNA polymerase specialized sigma24 family protein
MNDNYGELLQASNRITGNHELASELLHYALEQFLSKQNVQELVDSGAARYFIVRILMNQWNSNTSYFYTQFKKPSESLSEELENIFEKEDEQQAELTWRVEKILESLPWFDRLLFRTYVDEGHTKSSLARATGIPRTSISLSINRISRHIKRNL